MIVCSNIGINLQKLALLKKAAGLPMRLVATLWVMGESAKIWVPAPATRPRPLQGVFLEPVASDWSLLPFNCVLCRVYWHCGGSIV